MDIWMMTDRINQKAAQHREEIYQQTFKTRTELYIIESVNPCSAGLHLATKSLN